MWPFKSKEERVAELNEEISKLQAIVEAEYPRFSDAEMAQVKTLSAANMRVVSPPWAPEWDRAIRCPD